jgi:outer membrane usher protein
MSTRQCVRPSRPSQRVALRPFARDFLTIVAFFILLLAALSPPALAFENPSQRETIVVGITLNMEQKGDFMMLLTSTGDFLVKAEDLNSLGLRNIHGEGAEVDGELYFSLKSMQEVTFTFDEKTLTLALNATPQVLPRQTIDMMPPRQPNVLYPRDTAAFLNYSLSYAGSSGYHSTGLGSELGIRTGDVAFLSDFAYLNSGAESSFTRLMSNVTYDRREDMQRLVFGDFFASSGGLLGSSVNMGGISFSKVFAINPYFIENPLLNLAGVTALPSVADVYLNGMKIRSEKLNPGEFQLSNLQSYGGASQVDIVVRDPFGREQRLNYPVYFTDALLKKGLHEYSYNVGFLREQFGTESNKYGDAAFLLFHRYGVSDRVTVGVRAEGTNGLYNIGSSGSILMDAAGVISIGIAGSSDDQAGQGSAGSLAYSYQGRHWNGNLLRASYSEDYRTVESRLFTVRAKSETNAGIGYFQERLGSLSLNFTVVEKYGAEKATVSRVSYNKNLTGSVSLYATFARIDQQTSTNEFFIGLNYYPGKNITASAQYVHHDDGNTESLEVRKNQPSGEGLGYSATVQRTDTSLGTNYWVNPSVQYNSRYNIYRADLNERFGDGSSGSTLYGSISGAVVYAGNMIGLTRPVTDSFGLIKVGDIEGVRVYNSNQEIGRTNRSGVAYIPDMSSYYDNLISINDKDIPIDYTIETVSRYVSPPLRSGSCIIFSARKLQYITGRLAMDTGAGAEPVEFAELTLRAGERTLTFPSGRGGEFSFENSLADNKSGEQNADCSSLAAPASLAALGPGTYPVSFEHKGKKCEFGLVIPESRDMIVDVGEVVCR